MRSGALPYDTWNLCLLTQSGPFINATLHRNVDMRQIDVRLKNCVIWILACICGLIFPHGAIDAGSASFG